MTIPIPTAFKSNNTHRVLLHVHNLPSTDFGRIEDMTADATGAARDAVAHLAHLPDDMTHAVQEAIETIAYSVGNRNVLTGHFREAAQAVLSALARAEVRDAVAEPHDSAMRSLRDALNLSRRVADLVGAEAQLAWLRKRGR
jgi:hypothetical protein